MEKEIEELQKKFTSKQKTQLLMKLAIEGKEPPVFNDSIQHPPKWTPMRCQKEVNKAFSIQKSKKHEDISAASARSLSIKKGKNFICNFK